LELTALDGEGGDLFGLSAAANDNVVIIGAPGDGHPDSGSAYLFDLTTGQQISKLIASDIAELHGFGRSVAVDGKTAVVGSPGDQHTGESAGSAYLFDMITGTEIFKLTASDAEAYQAFGSSVAIASNTAVIGAPRRGLVAATPPGSAYVFSVVPEPETGVLLIIGCLATLVTNSITCRFRLKRDAKSVIPRTSLFHGCDSH
jgi:hypothetical protein